MLDNIFAPIVEIITNIDNIFQFTASSFFFVQKTLENILEFFEFLITSMPFAFYIASILPGIISVSCFIFLAIALLKLLVGR